MIYQEQIIQLCKTLNYSNPVALTLLSLADKSEAHYQAVVDFLSVQVACGGGSGEELQDFIEDLKTREFHKIEVADTTSGTSVCQLDPLRFVTDCLKRELELTTVDTKELMMKYAKKIKTFLSENPNASELDLALLVVEICDEEKENKQRRLK